MLTKPRAALGGISFALLTLTACGSGAPSNSETPPAMPIETMAAAPAIPVNADPLPSAHPNSIQPETTLAISAEGKVMRSPDIAFISTGVQSEAETAATAMADNSTAMNGVFRALEAANVDKIDMQTSNLSLQPRYDYANRQNGAPPRLVGYTASNQLTVKVRDLDNLGETLDALVAAGGNTFSGLRFALNDDRAAKNEARTIAMREAQARADLYARASGYNVARVVTISESGGFTPQPMQMARMSGLAAADSTPIASGEVGYAVTVHVTFELRKPE